MSTDVFTLHIVEFKYEMRSNFISLALKCFNSKHILKALQQSPGGFIQIRYSENIKGK